MASIKAKAVTKDLRTLSVLHSQSSASQVTRQPASGNEPAAGSLFVNLPLEIRLQTYELLFSSVFSRNGPSLCCPTRTCCHSFRIWSHAGYEIDYGEKFDDTYKLPPTALLRVCHVLRNEYKPLYDKTLEAQIPHLKMSGFNPYFTVPESFTKLPIWIVSIRVDLSPSNNHFHFKKSERSSCIACSSCRKLYRCPNNPQKVSQSSQRLMDAFLCLYPMLRTVQFVTLPFATDLTSKKEGELLALVVEMARKGTPQSEKEIADVISNYRRQVSKELKMLFDCHDDRKTYLKKWAREFEFDFATFPEDYFNLGDG